MIFFKKEGEEKKREEGGVGVHEKQKEIRLVVRERKESEIRRKEEGVV